MAEGAGTVGGSVGDGDDCVYILAGGALVRREKGVGEGGKGGNDEKRKSTGHDNNNNSTDDEKKDWGVVGWTPFFLSFFF